MSGVAVLPPRRPIGTVRLHHDRNRTLRDLGDAAASLAPFDGADVVWEEGAGSRRARAGSSSAIVRYDGPTLRSASVSIVGALVERIVVPMGHDVPDDARAIVRLVAATLEAATDAVRTLPSSGGSDPRDLGADHVPLLVAMRAAAPDADDVDAPGPYTAPIFDGATAEAAQPSLRAVLVPLALRLPALLLVHTADEPGGGTRRISIEPMGSMRGDPATDPDDPVEAMRALRDALGRGPVDFR